MYSREINGEENSFGVSGKLIRNVLVMYDRKTGTLWSQLLGEAVQGPLIGTKLEFLPAQQTTWEDWKAQYPETLALRKGYFGGRDPYESYYASNRAGVIGETFSDERLYTKEFIIGVDLIGMPIAFPFSVLNDEPVVNYTEGDEHILVYFNAESAVGAVFNRILENQTLTFKQVEENRIADNETGTIWNGLTGEAIEGPMAGSFLIPVKSTTSFWFGWKDFHPDTSLYGFD